MHRPTQTTSAFVLLILMLGIGGGWWFVSHERDVEDDYEVRIEPEEWQYAISDFKAATGRDATEHEKQLLLEGMVEEEILLAEGIRSAPWTADPVIRRRLVQLVSFFDVSPKEDDLRSAAREALLKRAEKYQLEVGGEVFDISEALKRSAE